MTRRIFVVPAAGVAMAGAFVAVAMASAPTPDSPAPTTFEIAPPAPVVACPGPQQVPVGDVGAGGDLASEPTLRELTVLGPEATRAVGDGLGADADIAVQTERTSDGDIQGWSAISCAQPVFEQWLVGGSTVLGNSARLVLSNPGAAPTEVTVTLYGPLGVIEDELVVPVAPGGQVERLIEGVATELSALVLHVEASGPGVVAALQDSRLEGFQPAGTDWVGASVAGTDLAIPMVNADVEGATVTVRLMAPEGGLVELSLVSSTGIESWSAGHALEMDPGVVTDVVVPTSQLGAIEVRSDAPVVAAALTTIPRAADEGLQDDIAFDHTWVSAMDVRTTTTLSAVVPAHDAVLAVYSPYATLVEVRDKDDTVWASANLAARTVQWVPITAPAGTEVQVTGVFAWVLVLQSPPGYIASAAPVDISRTSLSATVVPGTYPVEASN